MEFNWENFRNKIAVYLANEIEVNNFLEECEKRNLYWINGKKATECKIPFGYIAIGACGGLFQVEAFCVHNENFKILDWNDYMSIETNNNKINIMLDEGAYMPTKAHNTDAGFDLRTPYNIVIPATKIQNDKIKIGMATVDTGVHIELPEGTTGFIKSKSGLNFKHSITSEGVIDVGYTNSIRVKLYNFSDKDYCFLKGDKITQLVILPIDNRELEITDKLTETERGDGGFGSTGK